MDRTVLLVHETITGNFVADLTHLIAGGKWTDQIVGYGDATVTLSGTTEVAAGQITPQQMWSLVVPNVHSISLARISDDGTVTAIMWAGVILTFGYSDESQLFELYAEQVRTLFQHRLTFPETNIGVGDFKIGGLSRGAAAAAILTRGTQWGANAALPLDLPPAGGGGSFSTDVSRWDITTIEDILSQLEKYGTEIRFTPTLTAALRLRYTVTAVARYATGTITLSVTAAESPLLKYTATKDGRGQITGAFVTGKGQGSQMPHRHATGPLPGVPARTAYKSASDITDTGVLQAYATAAVAENRAYRGLHTFQVIPTPQTPFAAFTPGALLNLQRRNHPVLQDWDDVYRVIALAGDLASDILAPTVEGG